MTQKERIKFFGPDVREAWKDVAEEEREFEQSERRNEDGKENSSNAFSLGNFGIPSLFRAVGESFNRAIETDKDTTRHRDAHNPFGSIIQPRPGRLRSGALKF